jgi:hypothetical protein
LIYSAILDELLPFPRMGRAVMQVLPDFLGVGFAHWGVTGFVFAYWVIAKIITDTRAMIAVGAKFATNEVFPASTTGLHFAIAIPRTKEA